jgi:hypothetical protein
MDTITAPPIRDLSKTVAFSARRFSPEGDATAEFATLRLRLLKIAARVVETTSRVRLAFAAACPEADLIRGLPGALLPLGP